MCRHNTDSCLELVTFSGAWKFISSLKKSSKNDQVEGPGSKWARVSMNSLEHFKKKEEKKEKVNLLGSKILQKWILWLCAVLYTREQSFHHLYRDRSFIKCTISNPKNHTPAALTHQTKVPATACSKSNLCLYADISFHRLKEWVHNQHEAV